MLFKILKNKNNELYYNIYYDIKFHKTLTNNPSKQKIFVLFAGLGSIALLLILMLSYALYQYKLFANYQQITISDSVDNINI